MNDWLDAESHADRALEMYDRGRWAEAETELRKALSLNPSQPEWHFNLGLTLEAARRDTEALAAYERSIDLMPDQTEPLVAAGHAANRLGKAERAIDWFKQVIRLDLTCEPAYAGLVESHVRLGQHDEAETVFYLAQQALNDPSPHCLAWMAESLIDRSEHPRAAWCLREALRLSPNMPRLRAQLGTVLAATGKPQKAMQMFLRDLRDDPGNIDTLLDFGDLLIDLGRLPEAGEKLRRVLELEPANLDAHCNLGRIAICQRHWEQAYLEFELVIKLDTGYPQIRIMLAEALLGRGRMNEAHRYLMAELDRFRAGESTENHPIDLTRFGSLLLEVNEPAAAADLLEQSIHEDGETADRLRKLALARYKASDRLGGQAASRRVLRHDPKCVVSLYNLALAGLQSGQLRMAAGRIKRGMGIDRHDDGLRRLRMRLWGVWIRQRLRRALGRR